MAIDNNVLAQQLGVHGTVENCYDYEGIYYLITVSNWDTDIATFESIVDPIILNDFGDKTVTLSEDQYLKACYNKIDDIDIDNILED
jgi:hypothetical protein